MSPPPSIPKDPPDQASPTNGPQPSRPSQPSYSRSSSFRSQNPNPHAPLNPSTLREAHTLSASPGDRDGQMDDGYDAPLDETDDFPTSPPAAAHTEPPASSVMAQGRPSSTPAAAVKRSSGWKDGKGWHGHVPERGTDSARETTSLLRKPFEIVVGNPHEGPCNHGTFSPDLASSVESIGSQDTADSVRSRGFFGSIAAGITNNERRRATARLAEEHGLKLNKSMYMTYYIPFFAWIKQYKWEYLQGDLIAAITMASFYIPMALSLASNLAHIPPINGLYSFVFNPLIYAFLGSCPQMVVGPEAAGSLLVGSVVRSSLDKGNTGDEDSIIEAQIAGLVTGMAGAVIFIAGITRLGFLENVLSRPFMRGFISSVGFIIVIDQLIVEMGLLKIAGQVGGITHGSSVAKLGFLFTHFREAHKLTCAVAGISFLIIMTFREIKRRLQPRYPNVAYIPDRFLVVVFSAVLCYQFRWDKHGLEILGEVKSTAGGNPFPFHWPFQMSHINHIREAMGTSFLIALLGFFESSVAAKALGGGEGKGGDGIQGIQLSANRELVALGVANLVGGCFMALPAFGGYGRSKVNASTGGKTPMSSIFLSIITIICILFLLPYFFYLPRAVLSTMITVVAWSLIEEAPHDILFFLRIRALPELALMIVIFLSTIFYSLTLGIATGVGLSLLSVIRHATRPRIQILGRRPHTNRFENAELYPSDLEFVEGCLIVKIPEPLTFANTGDLKNRLRRLEFYGTTAAHPALPRVRQDYHNRNIIFDIHGVTGLDGSGSQVLAEIVEGYRNRGVRVWFSRGPTEGKVWELLVKSGIIEMVGGRSHYVNDVEEALRLTEIDADVPRWEYENEAGDDGGG